VTVGFGNFQRHGIANMQQCPRGGKINILNKKSYFLPSANFKLLRQKKIPL
jgi:hypothetical protein